MSVDLLRVKDSRVCLLRVLVSFFLYLCVNKLKQTHKHTLSFHEQNPDSKQGKQRKQTSACYFVIYLLLDAMSSSLPFPIPFLPVTNDVIFFFAISIYF